MVAKPVPIFETRNASSVFLTIAIPTYQRASLLVQAIRSALEQKDAGFEYDILVVDNNPERGNETEVAMAQFRGNAKISYLKNAENLGPSGNWNRLYQLARGEWVVMLHDDDLLSPDYLRVLKSCMDKFPADGYLFPDFMEFSGEEYLKMPFFEGVLNGLALKVAPESLVRRNYLMAPLGMCLKRQLVEALGGFDEKYYPSIDYEFYLRFSKNYNLVAIFGIVVGFYRWAENDSLNPETIRRCEIIDLELISEDAIKNEKSTFIQKLHRSWKYVSLIDKKIKKRASFSDYFQYVLHSPAYKLFKKLKSSRHLKRKFGVKFQIKLS